MRTFKFSLKKLKTAAGILLGFCVQQASAQNPVLSIPANYLRLAGVNTLPLPTGDYSGAAAVYGHNAMADANGELSFFMVDDNIYDKNGVWLAWLNLSGVPMAPSPELAIVPKPGSCTKYYLFYGRGYGGMGTTEPYYSELDVTASPGGISSVNLASLLPTGSSWATSRVAFAATKIRSDGSRLMFIYSGLNSVYRYKITASGITYDGYTYSIPGTVAAIDQHAELELYEKTDGTYKLALSSKTTTLSAGMVHTADLSLAGSVTASATYTFPAASLSEKISISGLEFSPNGNYLYVTHTTSASNLEPIQYINLNTGVLGSLAVTGKNDFKASYIELGKDGNMYLAASNRLARLSNPNFPNTANWTNNAYSVTNTPITHPGSSMPSVYVLPDQIDGMDYTAHYFQNSVLASPNQTICAGSCATINFSNATSAIRNPGGTIVTSPFTVCPGSTTTYVLTNAATSTCQKPAQVQITVVSMPAFVGTYSMSIPSPISLCSPAVTGDRKNLCTSPTGMGPAPNSPIPATFKCEIANSLGWQGANSVGVKGLTFAGSYTLSVYEVDNAGNRLPSAPNVYIAKGTGPYDGGVRFNEYGYSAGFINVGPYFVDPATPADPDGAGGGYDYFRNYYAYAFSTSTLPALSAKIWCVDMQQQPNPYCFVAKKSYFKIANNGLASGGLLRTVSNTTNMEINEASMMEWEVYPNPSSGMFNVLFEAASGNDHLDVYDYTGRLIHTAAFTGMTQRIDLSAYAKGVYFIRLTGNGISETKKIVLE